MRTIHLPVCGIVVTLNGRGGSISCHELPADDAGAECRAAVHGLLGLVLGHACAGVDVESPAYLEGVEVAVDSIANEYGD